MKWNSGFRYLNNGTLLVLFLIAVGGIQIVSAQTSNEEESNMPAFRHILNINTPTTTFLKRYGFEFQIRHRFGEIKPDKSVLTDFLGTDLTANIQFGFAFPLGAGTMFGFNRTKTGKTYDLHAKQLIISQSDIRNIPVTIAIYGDVAINSAPFRKIAPNSYFDDGITPFKNKFTHRLTYEAELLISRKFGKLLSAQVSPTFIYRNLVEVGDENMTVAIPLSGAIHTGKNTSLLFEYIYVHNKGDDFSRFPATVGYEFGTAGHVFQLIIASSQALIESNNYTSVQSDYPKGKFYVGFNLRRVFWHKKKIKRIALQKEGF